jgi:hypothetical protein
MVRDYSIHSAVEQAGHLIRIIRGIGIDAKPGPMRLLHEILGHEPDFGVDCLGRHPSRAIENCEIGPWGDQQRDARSGASITPSKRRPI